MGELVRTASAMASLGRLSIYDGRLAEHWREREAAWMEEIASVERQIDRLIDRALGGG